jgi:dienelactone hydrolase
MGNYKITALSFTGYGAKPLANRLFRQESETSALGILLPGLLYTCDMPLLYYTTQLLAQHGADVLQLHTDYSQPDFQNASSQEQAKWFSADADAAVQAGLAQRKYKQLVLVGKSIGTLALAHLVAASPGNQAATIWFTPLMRQAQLMEAALAGRGPALFLAGTGDPTYLASAQDRLRSKAGAAVVLIEGANHSLEIPGDLLRSLHIMQDIFQAVDSFLHEVLK